MAEDCSQCCTQCTTRSLCCSEDEEEAFAGAGVHLLAGESAQQAPHAGAQVLVLFGAHPSSLRVLTNAATTSDYPKLGDACVHLGC